MTFLSLILHFCSAVEPSIRWWMSVNNLDNNLAMIESGVVHGIYTYIGAMVFADGSFTCPHIDDQEWFDQHLQPYLDLIADESSSFSSLTPALGLNETAVISGAAMTSVSDVAQCAVNLGVSGFMLDFEPDDSSPELVNAYAAYIKALTEAMHNVGLRAEMCVSSWGILDGHTVDNGYGVYATTGVDKMMSMASTYFGTNITQNEANVQLELAQGVSNPGQLSVGIGTMISDDPQSPCPTGPAKWDYNWTEARLRDFVLNFLAVPPVAAQDLVFWRADIDNEGNCTKAYYFDVAKEFLQQRRGLVESLANKGKFIGIYPDQEAKRSKAHI